MPTYFTWRHIMSSTAISASAVAIAASAQHDADIAVCKQTLYSFDPNGASVAAMQAYANCVDLIYPDEMSDPTRLFLKLTILTAILGAVFAFVWVKRNGDDTITASFMTLFGAIVGGLVPSLCVGAFWSIGFLFS